jgi:AcrR family transcriptional regulator
MAGFGPRRDRVPPPQPGPGLTATEQVFSVLNVSSVADDMTARARIRNEALRLFAANGPDVVTVRQIATAAGVSPALVLHHFGSKTGLRQAVDDYAAHAFDALFELGEQDSGLSREGGAASVAELIGRRFSPDSPLPAYLRRLLLSGDPAGAQLFRSWFSSTVRMLEGMEQEGVVSRADEAAVRAAVLLVNDLAVIVMRDLVRDVLGVDPLSPAGLAGWAREVANLYDGKLWAAGPPAWASSAASVKAEP